MEREGRQEVRSQVRGGDNDKLCFLLSCLTERGKWRAGKKNRKAGTHEDFCQK